jgi:hypothetical protein
VGRRSVELAGSTRADPRGGLPSFTLASPAPPSGLPLDERHFEGHCRTQRRRLSGESRLTTRRPLACERWP